MFGYFTIFLLFKASGVSVADECLAAYNEIKLGHKHKYIIYKLSPDLREVIVAKKAELSEFDFSFCMCVIYIYISHK